MSRQKKYTAACAGCGRSVEVDGPEIEDEEVYCMGCIGEDEEPVEDEYEEDSFG
mgnify:CR=1 FL=1